MSQEKRPTAEQMAKFKKNSQDQSLSAEIRAKFQAIVDKFAEDVEGGDEPKKRGRKPSATRKPAAPRATKKTTTDVEQAKAEIKAKTGKTEAECEAIIEQYRALRTKAQEGKRKAEQASATNKKRVEKLDQKGDLIEGTNVKTADAVIESTAKDVAEKIEQQIEAVEEKAEKEAKAEVAKDKTIKTTTEKKEAVEAKVEKKVKEKTKTIVKRVVIDTSALLTSIADSLGKFDKDSQKEFLIKLRSDIDKLLAKYAFGGMTDGATQVMNVQQSNLSASSVNPTMFANGGGVGKLPANLKKRLDKANSIIVRYNGKPISEAEAIRFNSTAPIPQSGYNGGLKAFKLSNAKGFENATKRDYQTIGDALIDISRKMSGKDIYADGGVIGQEIVFDDNGEENSGVIKDITNLGDYVVKADDGRTLLAQRDLDVISFGAMRQQGVEQRKKRFGFFDEGGNVSDVEYDDILAVLEDKLTEAVANDISNSFENSYNANGEEVEHQSRDGFIAFTDGGFEVRWFEYLSGFYGSGYSLPTSALDKEKSRQIDLSLEDAKDYFKDEYPEIVEELGEENIDYNSLYEAGYESEAEDLSNVEMDMMDGTIMCEIGAYYYTPNNDRGIEGEHTLRLFGLVNLESPYHRSGNLEDRYDIDITFDSIEELEEKVDAGLKEITKWFNGSNYDESTKELRIVRMAKGGGVEGKLSYEEFVETLRDDDKINTYTGKTTTGMKMYYLPQGHPFLNMKFSHKNKRKAYNEYLSVANKKGFAKGGLTEHGLRVGDTIIEDFGDDEIGVRSSNRDFHRINLDKGKRFSKGGNVSSMLRNRRGQ